MHENERATHRMRLTFDYLATALSLHGRGDITRRK